MWPDTHAKHGLKLSIIQFVHSGAVKVRQHRGTPSHYGHHCCYQQGQALMQGRGGGDHWETKESQSGEVHVS